MCSQFHLQRKSHDDSRKLGSDKGIEFSQDYQHGTKFSYLDGIGADMVNSEGRKPTHMSGRRRRNRRNSINKSLCTSVTPSNLNHRSENSMTVLLKCFFQCQESSGVLAVLEKDQHVAAAAAASALAAGYEPFPVPKKICQSNELTMLCFKRP